MKRKGWGEKVKQKKDLSQQLAGRDPNLLNGCLNQEGEGEIDEQAYSGIISSTLIQCKQELMGRRDRNFKEELDPLHVVPSKQNRG